MLGKLLTLARALKPALDLFPDLLDILESESLGVPRIEAKTDCNFDIVITNVEGKEIIRVNIKYANCVKD